MMTLFAVSLAAAMIASGGVNQSRIDDVKSGKLTEARASWWGFDPEDSTSSIQSAINSGAKRVIIENMGQPWIVTPLVAASDQELVFEQGASASHGRSPTANHCRLLSEDLAIGLEVVSRR
ncbi:MAG TPA: hypothetical protein P5307_17175, partial [Pirellulaceae bacterium]|nr:hypothetical protein [Pirellulaceae bacterium]